jgi:hypothetical protein
MSIKLTTPYTVAICGSLVENDTDGALMSIVTDYQSRTQVSTFKVGTLTGQPPNLNAGPLAQDQNQTIVMTVHMDTGEWYDDHGHSGILPPAYLSPITDQAITNRNDGEQSMAVPGGLMPGVFTPWTSV